MRVSISCVKRDGNRVAHVLAKFARGLDEDISGWRRCLKLLWNLCIKTQLL